MDMIIKEFPITVHWKVVHDWCREQFGENSGQSYFLKPGDRWAFYAFTTGDRVRLQFDNEDDYNWFVLKWT